ncbi:MAG: hypothetical protein IPJ76_05395 [Flavobacteriales bacterium]|nr:MAG: hypothetical protein IPJ76_05395 [Flavobacteriales bacterium]
MSRFVLPLLATLFAAPSVAQIAHGGQPYNWGGAGGHQNALPKLELPGLDRQTLIAQEQQNGTEVRYGVQRFAMVDVLAQGQWDALPDDRQRCRLAVYSPGAVMLSVQFDQFDLAPGAFVYLYNKDRSFFIGGFTEANEQPYGGLATSVVPGDSIIIEVQVPANATAPQALSIASITHGYRDIFNFGEQGLLRDYDPGYQSSPCHNNTICPVASNYQVEKRAVAMFLRPDGAGCSGTLMNNTLQNGTPYFYFANHCYVPTVNQWVFYFNYESPTCVGSTGPTTTNISGSTLRANEYFDDFGLVELSSAPPANYNPYYAGWDRTGTQPTQGTAILHPLYDVKKITFDNNAPTSYTSLIPTPAWKCFWESGMIEAVGSGAPLFDQNKRVVGNLHEVADPFPPTCALATTQYSGFAKLSAAWDGTAASTRLRDWLDPSNSVNTLNGYDPFAVAPLVRVRLKAFLEGPYNSVAGTMNDALRTGGFVPLTEPYTALGYVHTNGGGGETVQQAVLNITGNSAVVDWVVVELRNKNNSAQIVASKSALLLRNGNVVSTDGTSDVQFSLPADDYYIALRHRNHLGIMTQSPQALTSTASLKDLSNASVNLNGGFAAAVSTISGVNCLWMGDAVRDSQLKYTGGTNDRDPILTRVGGTVPTATVNGYYTEDCTMDGQVKYTGTANDRDPILTNVGGSVPTATRNAQIP